MAMTIVEADRAVIGGVDTHLDVHVAAALDPVGGVLGVESFAASRSGYAALLEWLSSFGTVAKVVRITRSRVQYRDGDSYPISR